MIAMIIILITVMHKHLAAGVCKLVDEAADAVHELLRELHERILEAFVVVGLVVCLWEPASKVGDVPPLQGVPLQGERLTNGDLVDLEWPKWGGGEGLRALFPCFGQMLRSVSTNRTLR
jgi:hypothetical protein